MIVVGVGQIFFTHSSLMLGISCIAVGALLIGQGIWIDKKFPPLV